jgi:hypothetical protein
MNFAGKPCVIVASGPSLTEAQCELVRARKGAGTINVIVVNDNYKRVPNADALVAADQPWWRLHLDTLNKTCPNMQRWTCDPRAATFSANQFHAHSGAGFAHATEPGVKRGSSSGYMAVGLAAKWGATHICLIGFDCQFSPTGQKHWFGDHPLRLPVPQPVERWAEEFDALAGPAKDRGIRLVQCSISTATKKLIRSTLEEELNCVPT